MMPGLKSQSDPSSEVPVGHLVEREVHVHLSVFFARFFIVPVSVFLGLAKAHL